MERLPEESCCTGQQLCPICAKRKKLIQNASEQTLFRMDWYVDAHHVRGAGGAIGLVLRLLEKRNRLWLALGGG